MSTILDEMVKMLREYRDLIEAYEKEQAETVIVVPDFLLDDARQRFPEYQVKGGSIDNSVYVFKESDFLKIDEPPLGLL